MVPKNEHDDYNLFPLRQIFLPKVVKIINVSFDGILRIISYPRVCYSWQQDTCSIVYRNITSKRSFKFMIETKYKEISNLRRIF